MNNEQLIMYIQEELNTEEIGNNLINVARQAHKAELLLAFIYKIALENEHSQILSQFIIEAVDNG